MCDIDDAVRLRSGEWLPSVAGLVGPMTRIENENMVGKPNSHRWPQGHTTMFLPLKDENPLRAVAYQRVTFIIVVLCVGVFLWQVSLPNDGVAFIYSYGLIPVVVLGDVPLAPELVRVPAGLTIVTSMFLHGGWLHLGGNMLYLWVFGDNVEDSMGHLRYAAFYILCGIAAGLTHAYLEPASEVPMIGASGAISGVLGAYLILHPRVKVLVLVLFRFAVTLPAFIVLGSYIVLQILYVYLDAGGDTALWAHIGGFAAGALLIPFFRDRSVPLWDRGTGR